MKWMEVEVACKQCGSPIRVPLNASRLQLLCDDICLGAYFDRQPLGHFRQGDGGPLCTTEAPCELHERLALLKEIE